MEFCKLLLEKYQIGDIQGVATRYHCFADRLRSGSAIYDVSSRQSLFSTIIEEQPSLTVTVALLHLL
ncbi:hypothetical protein NC652_005002 [Populus alba x Populus x berolinensis]|nr:hypothetical protein NC652_005002 [Populus alba x Populus x berolinensis]